MLAFCKALLLVLYSFLLVCINKLTENISSGIRVFTRVDRIVTTQEKLENN